jgi:hypothetical protein
MDIREIRKLDPIRIKIEFAKLYIKYGWYLLLLHGLTKEGRCDCGNTHCKGPGKHPVGSIFPKGLKDATLELSKIEKWLLEYPNANLAVVTGRVSGITVLDFDVRDGGMQFFEECYDDYDYIRASLKQRTGGGGLHCIFKYCEYAKTGSNIVPGLDIRNDGGYIVVEPSNHVSGGEYKWIN